MVHNTARPYPGTHTFSFYFYHFSGFFSTGPSRRPDRRSFRRIKHTKEASSIDVWQNIQMIFLTITLPVFRTRTQLPLGLGMLNSHVAYRIICTNVLWRINQTIMETVSGPIYVALVYSFIIFHYFYRLHPYTLVRLNSPGVPLRSIRLQQVRTLFTV